LRWLCAAAAAAGKPVVAGTAVPTNTLRFTKDAKGAIKVQDMQVRSPTHNINDNMRDSIHFLV
jgi:hypothetical protein